MKDYKRLTKSDWHDAKFDAAVNKEHRAVLHRLWELENRIESGEIVDRNSYLDYLMAAKNTLELTDKEIEFFAKHNARVRTSANAEIACLTAENATLRERLDEAEHRVMVTEKALLNMTKKYTLAERKIAATKDGWFSCEEVQLAVLAHESIKEAEKELAELKEDKE